MNKNKPLKDKKYEFNKTHSLQFRILVTIIFAMFSITVFIGGISIYEVDQYIQKESEKFVVVTCENEGAQINNIFEDMEQSVKIMESYIMNFFTDATPIEDHDFQKELISSTDSMFAEVAKHATGAVAYYFRINPEISNGKTGLFYSKTKGSDKYIPFDPTDISLYEKEDTEHVGWFWQPYEAKKPVWMLPYYNKNNNIYMISYVIPIYHKDDFIGVVGIDYDYTILKKKVFDIKVYEHGFAYLETDGVAVHDDDRLPETEELTDTNKYLRVTKDLTNGMTLVLSAKYDDIRQIRYKIGFEILFLVVILSVAFTVATIVVIRRLVVPLKKLADASVNLSNGDYNVAFEYSNISEIELLNASFENMATRLREREQELLVSANRDSLTGLRNTTSYKSWVVEFDKELKNKTFNFGVAVFDLNRLKETNDMYGHAIGDKLIAAAAKAISDIFKRSPVFRIGGDEFVAILKKDLENYEELFAGLDAVCENTIIEGKEKIRISIARGFAMFEPDKDACFNDVFKRADKAMYENKREYKKRLKP